MFWKELSNGKGGKVESCSRVKDENGRLPQGEDGARKIWKEYFEDLYNIDLRKRLQSTCVALMAFREVTTLEESRLEELRLRCAWGWKCY